MNEAKANVFDTVPAGFFNCLASGSQQRMYADCLLLIYSEYEREISYRIPRERIRDAVAIYLAEHHISFEAEEGVERGNYQDLASAILRRFCSKFIGWLEEERDDATYEKQILMTERGILLCEFLIQVRKPQNEEYASYIFQIFNTLNNPDQWGEHPYINGLRSVFQSAKALSKSLKRLSTFIRGTIEKMIVEETLESLTENLLNYFDGSFIREYARLTKQQNIHVYRGRIKKRLDEIRQDEPLIQQMAEDYIKEEGCTLSEAMEAIEEMVLSSKQFLVEDYDRIMRDIKHKINVYLQVAVGRARFIRNREVDEKGCVEQTIKYITEEMTNLGWKDEITPELQVLFTFEKNEFIDTLSLRYPRKTIAIRDVTETKIEEMTEEDIVRAKAEQEKEAYNPYDKEKVKRYLERLLGSQNEIRMEDIPLQNREDLLMMLSSVAYGEENGFVIHVEDGYLVTDKMVIRKVAFERNANEH